MMKVELGEVLDYEQPTKYIVESDLYNDENEIPVLTAGKSFILGYTDETKNIFDDIPVIIFDDFTTATKFVDFPFKVKSSAMKILKNDATKTDIRFLFYLMQTIKINSEQHQRYWISKYSKIEIPLPPLTTQKAIAEKLDKADALRKKDQELLAQYDELAQAIFIDMFGDPVKNEKGWEMKTLSLLCNKITDGEHQNPKLFDRGKNLIMAKDVLDGNISFENEKFVSELDFKKFTNKCKPQIGDLLLVSRGATIGRCTVVDTKKDFCLMGSVILIKTLPKVLIGNYLRFLFKDKNFFKKVINVSSASAQQAIYIQNLKTLDIPIPKLSFQINFAEKIKNIEAQKSLVKQQAQQSEDLFQALLQESFNF